MAPPLPSLLAITQMSSNANWIGAPSSSLMRMRQIRLPRGDFSALHATNCFIGQSLALEALERDFRTLGVADADLGASVLAEIEFGQVPVKVFVIHVLVHADKAALEYRKEPFEGIGMDVAAHELELRVIDRFVLRLSRHDEFVDSRSVSDQSAVFMQMFDHGRAHVAMIQVHGADVPATLDETKYHRRGFGVQRQPIGLAGFRGLRQIGFVGFDGFPFAADQPAIVLHGLTDAMPEEPCGFHAASEHPLNLAGADAFLAGAHQVDDLQPQVQRQMAGLENGPHAHSEGLLAAVALAEAGSSGFPVQTADTITAAAMRADRAVGPETRFDVGESSGFVLELGVEKYGMGHGRISYGLNSRLGA